jgi:sulfatase maturation enzyme AslB (radical SAM superfamily)
MHLRHPEVRYEVTDHCNARCIMCPRDKHHRPHGVMDQDAYERSIDEVVALGATQVVLTGFGEPLLDPSLEDKVAYAHARGLRTYIITNASALTWERGQRLLAAGLSELRVSFYGMRRQTYNTVMHGLEVSRAIANIVQFLAQRDAGRYPCKVQLSYLVLPENEADVDAFRAFWESRVDAIEIWRPHNFGDGRDYRARTGPKRTCGRPDNGPLQIQWDGTVIPCCYDYDNKMPLGNAFQQPVPDILAGDRYRDLRDAHRKGEFHRFPYCDGCDQLLEHPDALVYSNRHNLPAAEAVRLSNTDLYDLERDRPFARGRF